MSQRNRRVEVMYGKRSSEEKQVENSNFAQHGIRFQENASSSSNYGVDHLRTNSDHRVVTAEVNVSGEERVENVRFWY